MKERKKTYISMPDFFFFFFFFIWGGKRGEETKEGAPFQTPT